MKRYTIFLAAASLLRATSMIAAQNTAPAGTKPNPAVQTPSTTLQQAKQKSESYPPALVESGNSAFQQHCAFCHGRDAGGGETGPDLTRSPLVRDDNGGEKIEPVIRNGRPDKGMPSFDLSDHDISALVAFIHTQKTLAETRKGGRKGVDASDLQTGNVEEGKAYFSGAGGCAGCHSPTGDLAGVASRFQGLQLEERMLYPRNAKSSVTVTLSSGQTISGELAYQDEFTIGLKDQSGQYRSWAVKKVKFALDAPVEAHVDLLSKYTDADIHNLMAYLQTLKSERAAQ